MIHVGLFDREEAGPPASLSLGAWHENCHVEGVVQLTTQHPTAPQDLPRRAETLGDFGSARRVSHSADSTRRDHKETMDTHSVSTALGSLDIKAIHFGQA